MYNMRVITAQRYPGAGLLYVVSFGACSYVSYRVYNALNSIREYIAASLTTTTGGARHTT